MLRQGRNSTWRFFVLFSLIQFLFKFQYPFHLHNALSISQGFFSPKNSLRVRYGVSFVSCLNIHVIIAFLLSYFVLYNIVSYLTAIYWVYINYLKQEFSISNTLAMEILQSCTKPYGEIFFNKNCNDVCQILSVSFMLCRFHYFCWIDFCHHRFFKKRRWPLIIWYTHQNTSWFI